MSLWDLVYSILLVVNNTILNTWNFSKRVDIILSVLITKDNSNQGGQEETFEGDGYVYGIDCDDGFTGVYLFPNSSSCTH